MRLFRLALLSLTVLLVAVSGRLTAQPLPEDGGGEKCWRCVEEVVDQVTYHLCKTSGSTGAAGCVGGGSGTQSSCTESTSQCSSTDDELLAMGYVARNGFSSIASRSTLSAVERRGRAPVRHVALVGRRDCKGYAVALSDGIDLSRALEIGLDQLSVIF